MRSAICTLGAFLLLLTGCGPGSEAPSASNGENSERGAASIRDANAGSGIAAPNPWNVVVITLDTTRADALGAYGQERPVTPILDSIAEDGVLFEHAYTASPSTLPSHSTLFTGRLPFEHGVRSNAGYRLDPTNETLAEILGAHGYETHAEVAAMVIAEGTGIEQGFARFRDPSSSGVKKKNVRVEGGEEASELELPERNARDITTSALEFLGKASEPFFLWLHYFDPHSFYAPPRSFAARFADSPYHGEVHYVDYELGRLFSYLRTSKLRERTLVVVTADHGEGLGEHRESTHSFFVFDSTMHIPLIFWGPPELPRGTRVSGVVNSSDVAMTVLDWLGVPVSSRMTGRSLRSSMADGIAGPGPAYGESFEPLALFGSSALRFLRLGRWKYHHKLVPELYDLADDPAEHTNLAEAQPERLAEMRGELERFVRAGSSPPDSRVEVSEDEWAMLNALGYVGGAAPDDFSDAADVASLRGPDPVSTVDEVSRYAVAWAANKTREYARGLELFEALLEKHPKSVPLLRGVIASLEGLEQYDGAAAALRRTLALEPKDSVLRSQLVRALTRAGRVDEARAEADFMLEQDDCSTLAVLMLSEIHRVAEDIHGQAKFLDAASRRCDGNLDIQNEFAYFLATAPEAPPRDPARAVRIARRIVDESGHTRADYLDTLACAAAARGNFAAAEKNALRAIEILRRANRDSMMKALEAHLALFREGRAVIEAPGMDSMPVAERRRNVLRAPPPAR